MISKNYKNILECFGGALCLLACILSLLGQQAPGAGAATRRVLPVGESAAAGRVRQLNGSLLQILSELPRSTPGQAALLRSRAARVAARRSAALSELALQSPREAASLAFSEDVLKQLAAALPATAAALESPGVWQGPIEYLIEDDVANNRSRATYRIRSGSESLPVSFAGRVPAGLRSGDLLRLTGIRSGNRLVATTAARVSAEALTTGTALAAPSCSTTGVQNIAVLLVTFPGVTPPASVTSQSVYDTFFGTMGHSLDGFWKEASYGKTSAAGDVFGWYTLDTSYTCSQGSEMRDAAITNAAAAGVNFQNYTRIFVIYPDIGCTAGFATVGCSTVSTPSGSITASTAYIEANYMDGDRGLYFVAHEGGHNLGLQHAGTLDFGTETLGPLNAAGTVNEFGDWWSVMGSQTLGQYSAQQKAEVLQWLADGVNYQVVQASGSWSLQPFEIDPAGLEALKIQRGTGNDAWLWVEYRQPLGDYDSTLLTPQPFSGALIHYEDPTTGAFTHLLDFTPDTDSWFDPALVAGQTWVDPYTNLSISVPSATAGALTVSVNYGATPCTHASPGITVSPLDPSADAGTSVSYNLTVTNNDAAGCSSSTFSLNSGQPSGWLTAFSPAALTLGPGQTASVTMSKTVPAGTAAGTYSVDASAADAMSAGSAAANCTVTTPPVLSVSVSIPGSTYSARQTVSIAAMVLNGNTAAAGASVSFTLTQPNGGTTGKSVRTDSTGKAVWNYKIGSKGPPGSYSVSATAIDNSQAAASNTASFTVQ